jgi:hypothetical protein
MFVIAGLALLGACSSTASSLKRELGPTPQQQIQELEARLEQCEQRRAAAESERDDLRRAIPGHETAPPPAGQ